ncbi:hypothetical protein [Novipirellula aureliae]|uniref:hypothetical protein n=1 Tax=Novipirellula aureliae TaxID=2527966 RepID=UPI0018CF3350|nr:hypothetical protein [Novipirellula aureliae]
MICQCCGEFTLELFERLAAGGAERSEFGQQFVGIAGTGAERFAGVSNGLMVCQVRFGNKVFPNSDFVPPAELGTSPQTPEVLQNASRGSDLIFGFQS